MRKGLTANVDAIIEQVSELESIKPYVLCGGTALAMQLDHRRSEDLDFMMWRKSKSEKPEIDWPAIERELTAKIGAIESFNLLGFEQVEFVVRGVKLSFYVSDNYCPVREPLPYMGNIRFADAESIMAMKIEVMLRRTRFRDYYDIYSILLSGCNLKAGIDAALKYSSHKLTTKNVVMLLLSTSNFVSDDKFDQLEPKYKVSTDEIREYLLSAIRDCGIGYL